LEEIVCRQDVGVKVGKNVGINGKATEEKVLLLLQPGFPSYFQSAGVNAGDFAMTGGANPEEAERNKRRECGDV
jgi:hypothetical protein